MAVVTMTDGPFHDHCQGPRKRFVHPELERFDDCEVTNPLPTLAITRSDITQPAKASYRIVLAHETFDIQKAGL